MFYVCCEERLNATTKSEVHLREMLHNELRGHRNSVLHVQAGTQNSWDQNLLLSGSADKTARLWFFWFVCLYYDICRDLRNCKAVRLVQCAAEVKFMSE